MSSRGLRKLVANKELNQVQTNIQNVLAPLLNSPIGNGILLSDLELISGTNIINHKLGREPQGWFVVDRSSAATIYSTAKTKSLLTLVTSGALTVSLWVF